MVNTQTKTEPPKPADAPSARTGANAADRPSVAESLQQGGRSLLEAASYLEHLIVAYLDQIKLSLRTAFLYALLGVLAALAAGAVLVVSVVLLLAGIANGLGEALGGRAWAGDLIVGVAVLGGVSLAIAIALGRMKSAMRRRTKLKYEERLKQQRERFGRDASGRPIV
jgi:hypothetical protein